MAHGFICPLVCLASWTAGWHLSWLSLLLPIILRLPSLPSCILFSYWSASLFIKPITTTYIHTMSRNIPQQLWLLFLVLRELFIKETGMHIERGEEFWQHENVRRRKLYNNLMPSMPYAFLFSYLVFLLSFLWLINSEIYLTLSFCFQDCWS